MWTQSPIKKTWPRCPSCKTPLETHQPEFGQATEFESATVSQPKTPPANVPTTEDHEISLDPHQPVQANQLENQLSLPAPVSLPEASPETSNRLPPDMEQSTVVEASLLSVASAVQTANEVAKAAGFDRTCSKCNAPVCFHHARKRCPVSG